MLISYLMVTNKLDSKIIGNSHEMPSSVYGFIFHYYRAEVYRETNWRNRLDNTTNWAIVVSAAILSYAFSEIQVPHTVILINFLMVWFFLYIESRRFRYYSMLRYRTRLMEKQLLAPIFMGSDQPFHEQKWKQELAQSFTKPSIEISRLESIAWRLRRIYIVIFPVLFLAWLSKLRTTPLPALTLDQIFENARVGFVPGMVIFYAFLFSVFATIAIALYVPQASHHDDLP